MPMKVLVTGATGFLGGYVVEELLKHGFEVVGLARKTSNTSLLEELGVEIRWGDITNAADMLEAVKDVDAVVHLAAYYTFHGEKERFYKVNVGGTRNVIEAALKNKVKRFIYCSTTEAVGPVKNPPADETYPPNPTYEYGRSKLEAEKLVSYYGNRGLEYTILRPTGLYGPRNVNDVSYWFIKAVAERSLLARFVVGSGENLIQFTHAADAAQSFRLALEREESIGEVYFIGDEKAYTYNEVYKMVAELAGVDPPDRHIPPWLAKLMIAPLEFFNKLRGEENFLLHVDTVDAVTSDRAYSIEKAKKQLGFQPKYSLRDGLKETLEWYIEHGYVNPPRK